MVYSNEIEPKSGTIPVTSIAIDESLNIRKTMFEDQIENILDWIQSKIGAEQFVQAQEQFFWKTGKFFSDDPWYTSRINYFINHFIFERPLESPTKLSGMTPYQCYEIEFKSNFLNGINHSIFSVLKVSENSIIIRDLIHNLKIKVCTENFERFEGILKNDMFQGFIFNSRGQNWMTMGIIFHPYKAYRTIKKNIKKESKSDNFQPSLLLYQLARQQLKHQRHIHVNPKLFYTEGSV